MRTEVQEIFKATPIDKQVMMFSATLAQDMRAICKKFMVEVCGFIFQPSGRSVARLLYLPLAPCLLSPMHVLGLDCVLLS